MLRIGIFLLVLSGAAMGQWKKLPSSVPLGRDGKPNLSAPAPKLADGKPDLSGIWQPNGVKFLRNLADPATVPFQPWSKKLVEERADPRQHKFEPDAHCLPQGVPKIMAAPVPYKFIQTPGTVVILYEAFNLWRQVFLDGRELIDDPNPTWLGYSTGRYEGDTLVIETRGFNGKSWLDSAGLPATEKLHVTERIRRKDFGHLEYRVTIDDPGAYTRPFTVTEDPILQLDTELLEFICAENEKDLKHMN